MPRSLAPFAWARHALATPPFDWLTRRLSAHSVPVLEREVLGRTSAFGAHSVERGRGEASGGRRSAHVGGNFRRRPT